MEKRALIRKRTQISVACSNLTASSSAVVFKGTMLNCSCGGTCIELDHVIRDGNIMVIKATDWRAPDRPQDLPEGFRTLSLAEVKWSKPLEDENVSGYLIGFRYLVN
jgi:hypothetical protein